MSILGVLARPHPEAAGSARSEPGDPIMHSALLCIPHPSAAVACPPAARRNADTSSCWRAAHFARSVFGWTAWQGPSAQIDTSGLWDDPSPRPGC